MKHKDVLQYYADRWRSLRAWRAAIPMRIALKTRKTLRRSGTAWSHEGRAIVYMTSNIVYDLSTVLHELAHLAAPNSEHHGQHWRELFVAAAVEAFGGAVDDYEIDDVAFGDIDAQVEDAARNWFKRTGQETVLKAIGVAS